MELFTRCCRGVLNGIGYITFIPPSGDLFNTRDVVKESLLNTGSVNLSIRLLKPLHYSCVNLSATGKPGCQIST